MNRTALRAGVALGLGLGLAGALAAAIFDGDKISWPATAVLGLELAMGVVVGFLSGCGVAGWLHSRVAPPATVWNWAVLGFAAGITFALAMIAWWAWQWDPPFESASGFAVLGLWNGLLLGVGFGDRPPAADPGG